MGDDGGIPNISAYNRGMMGYKTPNIDSIANEGILFTDAFGQNSCSAGRAAFTSRARVRTTPDCSRSVYRVPKKDSTKKTATIAEMLKPMGVFLVYRPVDGVLRNRAQVVSDNLVLYHSILLIGGLV